MRKKTMENKNLKLVEGLCEARCASTLAVYRNDPEEPCMYLDTKTGLYYHKSVVEAPKKKAKKAKK